MGISRQALYRRIEKYELWVLVDYLYAVCIKQPLLEIWKNPLLRGEGRVR
jgi:hypothetical protein